jgi:hypothetical protein
MSLGKPDKGWESVCSVSLRGARLRKETVQEQAESMRRPPALGTAEALFGDRPDKTKVGREVRLDASPSLFFVENLGFGGPPMRGLGDFGAENGYNRRGFGLLSCKAGGRR